MSAAYPSTVHSLCQVEHAYFPNGFSVSNDN